MRRVAVVVFPGSNCDADTLDAARAAGSEAYYVWHRDTDLQQADAVILPGGFSYGDYLRSGAIARFSPVLHTPAMSFVEPLGLSPTYRHTTCASASSSAAVWASTT